MTKQEKIIELLSQNEFISGEEIAQKCEVSRAYIHKVITQLRNDGYSIEAITNKGYKLTSKPDLICGEIIEEIIKKLGGNTNKVTSFETIDSTNTEARRQCSNVGAFRDVNKELTEGGKKLHRCVLVSGQQTQGRGRMGRVFVSPANSGVYISLIYSPKNGVSNPAFLTAAAAVAVAKSVDELYNAKTKIKWVNDVFLSDKEGNNKKICGILTEGIANFETGTIESAIVGIGVNVRNNEFDEDISKVAGCIEDLLCEKKSVSRNEIVAHIIFYLLKYYDSMENQTEPKEMQEMMKIYKEKSILIGKTVVINPAAGLQGEKYKAKVLDISNNAELIVETENGEKKSLHSGEVSLHSYDFI